MCDKPHVGKPPSAKKKASRSSSDGHAGVVRLAALPKTQSKLQNLPADHHDELRRVSRLIGQLEGVRRMIEDQRYCIDILTQTRAAAAALRALEGAVLRGHMNHCLRNALLSDDPDDVDTKIEELIDLFNKKPT